MRTSILTTAALAFAFACGTANGTEIVLRANCLFEQEQENFFAVGEVVEQLPDLGLFTFLSAFTVEREGESDVFVGEINVQRGVGDGDFTATISGFATFVGDLVILGGEWEVNAGTGVFEDVTGGGAIAAIARTGRDPAPIVFEVWGDLEGSLPCTEALDGDLNFDGCTDFADTLVVLSNWGTAGPEGDANCDGIVDFADQLVVLSGWSDDCE